MVTNDELRQKIFDEKIKSRDKETEQMDAWWDRDQKEYLEIVKKDRHPMSYTVNKEVEEWWQSAPLSLELDQDLSMFFWICMIYSLLWALIGCYFAISMLTNG